MFFSLAFPFEAQRFMSSHSTKIKVYFIEVVVIVTVGLLPSTITISTSRYEFIGYTQGCAPSSTAGFFYTILLPMTIGATIGISLLCASVLVVRRVSC